MYWMFFSSIRLFGREGSPGREDFIIMLRWVERKLIAIKKRPEKYVDDWALNTTLHLLPVGHPS